MKKISYILGGLGVILILISILLLNATNNDEKEQDSSDILWTTEYQKGNVDNKNISKYSVNIYKNEYINQNKYYIIPQDAYLSCVENHIIEYQNDKMTIVQYNYYVNIDEISKIIKSYDNMNSSVEILKKELPNGNVVLLEKNSDEHYAEILNLFIKIDNNSYYHIYYRIYDMNFSDSFIEKIINIEKIKDDNYISNNQDGEWNLSLDTNNKKRFNLKYNSSKYFKEESYQNYELNLKVDKNSYDIVRVLYNYNVIGINDEIQTPYTISNSKKIKLKNYDTLLYTIMNNDNREYINYDIMIDKYTKLRISYPKNIEDKVNINDFLNFTYE